MTSESPTHPDAPRAGGETPDILAELDRYLDAYRDAIIAEQYAGPELDVEACVRLLKRIASQLRADGALGMSADGDRLDALASALPGMAELRAAATHYIAIHNRHDSVYIRENGRHGHSPWAELVDAARAAQPEETSADAK